jgi:hypothetical protein
MDIERFQVIEKQLAEQAEANRITNENLANLLWMMSARESKNIVPIPPALTPAPHPITTIPKALQLSGDTGGSADASEYPRERLE